MAEQLNTVLVVSSSYADPELRWAFNVRLKVAAAALARYGIVEARAIFVGGDVKYQDEPIDLTLPPAQLDIPCLMPGNALHAVLEAWKADGPHLAVVITSLAGINPFAFGSALRDIACTSLLFVPDKHPAGEKHANALFLTSKQIKYMRVVMPSYSSHETPTELRRLFKHSPHLG